MRKNVALTRIKAAALAIAMLVTTGCAAPVSASGPVGMSGIDESFEITPEERLAGPGSSMYPDLQESSAGVVTESMQEPVPAATWPMITVAKTTSKSGLPSRYPGAQGADWDPMAALAVYPPTRDQTTGGVHYGSCWVHAIAALAEFYHVRRGIPDMNGPVDASVNYSELQLAWECYHGAEAPTNGATGDSVLFHPDLGNKRNFLNFGGNMKYASVALMRQVGLASEHDGTGMPTSAAYENAPKTLRADGGPSDAYRLSEDVARVKNVYFLDSKDKATLKRFIMDNGAVSVSYYSDVSKFLSKKNAAYYDYTHTYINHVVTVVGWNDQYPAENFKKTAPGDGAWLVRNSHSADTRLAEESYFWLSYYDTSIGATAFALDMCDPRVEWYDATYCYDSQLHDARIAGSGTAANVFTARESMDLLAVQVDATVQAAGNCTIKVYRGIADSRNPESGTLAAVSSGTLGMPGRYTIRLDKNVRLKAGENFSVVVTCDGRVDREADVSLWKKQFDMDVTVHRGQSFVKDGNSWQDLADNTIDGTRGNVCIRALGRTDHAPVYEAPRAIDEESDDGDEEAEEAYAEDEGGYTESVGHLAGDVEDDDWPVSDDPQPTTAPTPTEAPTRAPTKAPTPTPTVPPVPSNPAGWDSGDWDVYPTSISVTEKCMVRAKTNGTAFTKVIDVKCAPSSASMEGLTWRSSNDAIATVTMNKNGDWVVVGGQCGIATLTATARGGATAKCKVAVFQWVYECSRLRAIKGNDASTAKFISASKRKNYEAAGWTCWTVYRYLSNFNKMKTLEAKGWECQKAFRGFGSTGKRVYYGIAKDGSRQYTAVKAEAIQWRDNEGMKVGRTFTVSPDGAEFCGDKVYHLQNGRSHRYVLKDTGLQLRKNGWTSHSLVWYAVGLG